MLNYCSRIGINIYIYRCSDSSLAPCLGLDFVFVRRDLLDGKYSPDLDKQAEFEVEMYGKHSPVMTRQCRDWSHQINLGKT